MNARPGAEPPEDELLDVGAQAERTALAWQRTGLGAMAVGALLIHANRGLPPHPWPGLLLMAAAGLAVLVLVPRRYRRILRTVRVGHTPLSGRMVPGSVLVLLVVVAGSAVAILRT